MSGIHRCFWMLSVEVSFVVRFSAYYVCCFVLFNTFLFCALFASISVLIVGVYNCISDFGKFSIVISDALQILNYGRCCACTNAG